jgi:hypothetical protein
MSSMSRALLSRSYWRVLLISEKVHEEL